MKSSIYGEDISSLYILDPIILLSLDNDVLETSKRRAMFYNILSQIFIVKCFTKSLLIRIPSCYLLKWKNVHFSVDLP